MKKLAANTLMEILPEEMQNMVKLILTYYQFMFWFWKLFHVGFSYHFQFNFQIMKKLDEDPTMTHDFLTIVGLVSYC